MYVRIPNPYSCTAVCTVCAIILSMIQCCIFLLEFLFNDFFNDFNLFCICISFKFKPHLIAAVPLLISKGLVLSK